MIGNVLSVKHHLLKLLVVVVAAAVLLVIAGVYVRSKTKTDDLSSQKDLDENAIFKGPSVRNHTQRMAGRIQKREGIQSELGVEYVLLSEDNSVKSYLYSRKHNLSLSVGLPVEVEGVLTHDKYINGKVIRVDKIILK